MSEQDGTSDAADDERETTESEANGDAESGAASTAAGEQPQDEDHSSESTPSEQAADEAADGEPHSDAATSNRDVAYESRDDSDVDLDVADDIIEYVESTPAAEVADEIATLRFEVDTLESDVAEYEQELEDLKSRIRRKQADFENYKKRMQKRREEEQARATEDLVTRLLDVRDNLTRALEQDEDTDIRDGVDSTLKQFDRILEDENVEPVEPEPGDEVDPERHEVLVRMDSEQPPGTIAQVHRPGYEMAGKVIRTAQVAVSEGE